MTSDKKKLPPQIGSEKRMQIDYGIFKIMETKDRRILDVDVYSLLAHLTDLADLREEMRMLRVLPRMADTKKGLGLEI